MAWNIDRKTRIELRAKQYAEGKIDLQTFYDLETLDETPDEQEAENKVVSITDAEEYQAPPEPKPAATKKGSSKLNITKADFDKLSLAEQQALYTENPAAVESLVNGE